MMAGRGVDDGPGVPLKPGVTCRLCHLPPPPALSTALQTCNALVQDDRPPGLLCVRHSQRCRLTLPQQEPSRRERFTATPAAATEQPGPAG